MPYVLYVRAPHGPNRQVGWAPYADLAERDLAVLTAGPEWQQFGEHTRIHTGTFEIAWCEYQAAYDGSEAPLPDEPPPADANAWEALSAAMRRMARDAGVALPEREEHTP